MFAGKVAVVTGASSGIGRATALGLSREGASVVLVSRDQAALEAVAAEAAGPTAVVAADVTADDTPARVVAEAVARFGGIDVLVNAAGIIGTASTDQTPDELFDPKPNHHFHVANGEVTVVGLEPGLVARVSGDARMLHKALETLVERDLSALAPSGPGTLAIGGVRYADGDSEVTFVGTASNRAATATWAPRASPPSATSWATSCWWPSWCRQCRCWPGGCRACAIAPGCSVPNWRRRCRDCANTSRATNSRASSTAGTWRC